MDVEFMPNQANFTRTTPEEFKGDIGQIIPSFHGNDSLAHSTQVHRKVGQHLAGQMSLTAVPEGSADI